MAQARRRATKTARPRKKPAHRPSRPEERHILVKAYLSPVAFDGLERILPHIESRSAKIEHLVQQALATIYGPSTLTA